MLILGVISSDEALHHAIAEQLPSMPDGWQMAGFSSLDDALAAWGEALPTAVFWDAATAPAKDEQREKMALLFKDSGASSVLITCDLDPGIDLGGAVAETFQRPLRLGQLLSRLHYHQRLAQLSPSVTVQIGPWMFSPRLRTLTPRLGGGEAVRCTDKEAAVLDFLCQARTAVSREDLLETIWGYGEQIDTHTLETHIYRLRRKLLPDQPDDRDEAILAEPGGYKMNPSWVGE